MENENSLYEEELTRAISENMQNKKVADELEDAVGQEEVRLSSLIEDGDISEEQKKELLVLFRNEKRKELQPEDEADEIEEGEEFEEDDEDLDIAQLTKRLLLTTIMGTMNAMCAIRFAIELALDGGMFNLFVLILNLFSGIIQTMSAVDSRRGILKIAKMKAAQQIASE